MKLEQYQIIHSNKLIAEFMGLETATFIPSGHLNYYHREFDSGTWYEVHELSYNLSWDWLMPVVGKLLDQDEYYGASDHRYRLKDALVETNIDSMYKIVVEFINKCNWKSNMNGNKVIAEFMGDYDYNIEGAIPYGDFTNSWDWLMPVIEQIDHSQSETVKGIEDALATRVIGDVYKAVLEFIINKYKN